MTVTGDRNAGQASCTVSVSVTASGPGTYDNGPANLTTVGLDPPAPASVSFTSTSEPVDPHLVTPVAAAGPPAMADTGAATVVTAALGALAMALGASLLVANGRREGITIDL